MQIIIRGIDRAAQRRRYPEAYEPHPMILTHILREVDSLLASSEPGVGLLRPDPQARLSRAMLERHRTAGTPGYKRTTLSEHEGQLEFVRSIDSPLIQAAGIVAYLRHRRAPEPNPTRSERRLATSYGARSSPRSSMTTAGSLEMLAGPALARPPAG